MWSGKLRSHENGTGRTRRNRVGRPIVLCSLAVLAAPAAQQCGPGSSEDAAALQVAVAYGILVSGAASCGLGAAQCAQLAQGDQAALAVCADKLQACTGGGQQAATDLGDKVSACVAAQQGCAGGEKNPVCALRLVTCLGVPNLAIGCLGTMQTCVDGGGDIPTCAQEVGSCVLQALPDPATLQSHPSEVLACLQGLDTCLKAGTSPDQCLQQAITCVKAANN